MRSLFSGVSGLKAHQTKMDVIGNNVSNVNTVAFKSGRVTFQEVFSEMLQGATSPNPVTGTGGTNPMQVGLGMGIGSVDTLMTRGSLERTDNPTDLSIEGDGFFIEKQGNGSTYEFSRAGNFNIDKLGNLVSGSGANIYGWEDYNQAANGDYVFNTGAQIEPLNLYQDPTNNNKKLIAAKATTMASLSGNLDASNPNLGAVANASAGNVQFSVPLTVYDALGNKFKLTLVFGR